MTKRLSKIDHYYILSAVPLYCFALLNGAPPVQTTLGVVTMQMGGCYSNILPIYFVCFLLIFPFALAPSINKPILMLAASALIYTLAQLTEQNGFFGSPSAFVTFDIATWQFLLVCGVIIGQHGKIVHSQIKATGSCRIAVSLVGLLALSVLFRANSFYPNPLNLTESLHGNLPRLDLHPIFLLRIGVAAAAIALILI